MNAIGIDVGGSRVKAAAIDADGAVRTARSENYRRPSLGELRAAIAVCLDHLGVDRDRPPDAVGLCLPGRLAGDGRSVAQAVNLPALEGVPFADLLGLGIARHPRVVSDAHAAAHDLWCTDRPPGRLLALSLGTGVGACVLDEGVPLRCTGAGPGHLGQIDVGTFGDVPAPLGPDGGRGTLEGYIGLNALAARFGDGVEQALATLDDQDPALLALARAIRIAHAIFRPRTVALLGGIGVRLAPRLDGIRRTIGQELTRVADPDWTLMSGRHDHHAAIGAARLALAGSPV